jgi:hypothetical protein
VYICYCPFTKRHLVIIRICRYEYYLYRNRQVKIWILFVHRRMLLLIIFQNSSQCALVCVCEIDVFSHECIALPSFVVDKRGREINYICIHSSRCRIDSISINFIMTCGGKSSLIFLNTALLHSYDESHVCHSGQPRYRQVHY